MPARQASLPSILLMTDLRMGDALWPTIAALPRGSGIIFRHYGLERAERRILYERVRRIARARGLRLILAGPVRDAVAWRADGVHGAQPGRRAGRPLLRTSPVHDARELHGRRDADLRLVSPVFATRSHPDAQALGRVRLGLLIGRDRSGIVALGGMTADRARALRNLGIGRWAAIDGLARRPCDRP